MATYTSRMGLIKPAGSEPRSITPIASDMDLLDKFMPCILVNDGVTPPTVDLYDGALVKERTSGIIWEARKNGGGTYDKVYVRYPLHFQGTGPTISIANSAGTIQTDLNAVNASYCKNTSAANIVGGRFVAPVKGIYSFTFRHHWAGNATGYRFMQFGLNGVFVGSGEYVVVRDGNSIGGAAQTNTLDLVNTTILAAGDAIAPGAQQNSGGPLNVTAVWVKVALIEPVQ